MGRWTDEDARESEEAIRSIIPNVIISNRLGTKDADFNTYENEIPYHRTRRMQAVGEDIAAGREIVDEDAASPAEENVQAG